MSIIKGKPCRQCGLDVLDYDDENYVFCGNDCEIAYLKEKVEDLYEEIKQLTHD